MIIFADNMRIIKKIVGAITLALFLAYFSGSFLFPHTHSYAWGTVTHSHPYLPSSHHNHSTGSLQVIEHLTHLTFVVASFLFFGLYRVVLSRDYVDYKASPRASHFHAYSLRGPPSVC